MTHKGDLQVILIVEDYDDTREMMRVMLESQGCRVLEAADGQQAIELARRFAPTLIFMDLNLPTLDGYEATRQIHGDPATQNVPVIAFSAQCDLERRRKALEAGCVECIQKPIDFEVIEEIVSRYSPV